VSASVNLPLHHQVQTFSSGTGSPGWSWKKGRKTVVVVWFGRRKWSSCFIALRCLRADILNRLDRTSTYDRQTDGHTPIACTALA